MIVSIGEALIDYKNGKPFIGGCPLNVSLALARQGEGVSFLGGISSDADGMTILQFIIDNCILFDPIFCNSDKRTMTTEAKVENSTVIYSFDWKDTSAFQITEEKLEAVFANNTDIDCVFFGSVAFSDVSVSKEILSFLKKRDIFKFFDPNIRSFVISDKNEYLKYAEEAAGISDIVKLSEEDLTYWGKTENQILEICKGDLIVTRGEKGSSWYSKALNKTISVPSNKVENIKDTIGCGDTYSATVLSCLNRMGKFEKYSLTESEILSIMTKASKAASINCTREGCNPPEEYEIS